MEGGPNGRTLKSSPVLTRKFSVVHSSNLLHRPKEDNAGAAATATAPKTLANVLALERKRGLAPSPSGSSRSLLDIIRHESTNNADYAGATQSVDWRTFKDRLILQRATTAFSSTSSSFSSSSSYHRHHPAQAPDLAPTIPTTSTADETMEAGEPVRVSLMTLLEQTDRMGGLRISGDLPKPAAKVVSPVKAEEEEDDDDDGEMVHVCGVCMVRHKGAAFIPCGHTFCRLCSRELWVSRGNCPLCNGYILEILDIF